MLTNNYPFQKNLFNYRISIIKAKPVTRVPFSFKVQLMFQCLPYLQNFILLKSVKYIKSYRYVSALC